MLAGYYVMELAYKYQTQQLQTFLISLLIDPDMNHQEKTTPKRWAYWISHKCFDQNLAKDACTMLGNIRSNRQVHKNRVQITNRHPRRYADTKNYRLCNLPHVAPEKLTFLLRWKPLTEHFDSYVDFSSHVHVTPYIGKTVKPLKMDMRVWKTSKTYAPYQNPSRQRQMSSRDYRKLMKHMIPNIMYDVKAISNKGMQNKAEKRFRAP